MSFAVVFVRLWGKESHDNDYVRSYINNFSTILKLSVSAKLLGMI